MNDRFQCDQLKGRPMSLKVAQNDFIRKIKDFEIFTKSA